MSEPSKSSRVNPLAAARAARQRQRDHDGRPDRVAELAADIEDGVQRARWSLDVRTATDIVDILRGPTPTDTLDDGVWVSGDHRPGRHPWGRANRAAAR